MVTLWYTIACSVLYSDIVTFDQRLGPLRNIGGINAHNGHTITDLKYSSDGSYLVSAGEDDFIRLWDIVIGDYQQYLAQLQAWNMREEVTEEFFKGDGVSLSISTCSRYIAASICS